ncbi:MAG: hypothetical protein ACN2B6_11110 [Rickettsiales bacterium]
MSQETNQHKNWLTSIPDRLSYGWHAPEQRFEWIHLTRRRLFRNLANIPGELIGWSITTKARGKKPLLPDFSGDTSYSNPGQLIDSSLLTGILFKQVLDISAKFGLSTYVKTTVAGYNRNEDYKGLMASAASLRNIAIEAVQSDPNLQEWAQQLAERDDGALLKLSRHNEQASQIMMDLAQGQLLPTQENLDVLQTQMQAMSELADQKAGLISRPATTHPAPDHPAYHLLEQHKPQLAADIRYGKHERPSQHIRDVLKANRLNDAKEAVIYLATLSGLVADGAVDISSELFTLKDDDFFTAKDARKVRHAMEGIPKNRGVVAIANHLKSQLRDVEKRIEPLLAYADLHYADIDQQLIRNAPHDTQTSVSVPPHQKPPTGANTARPTQPYYSPNQVGLEYIVRDEAKHEMVKLYSRSLPNYLYQAPINLVERLILPNAKGKWEFNRNIVGGELKAASWMALYNPVAESFGGVSLYEATRLDIHRAAEAGKRMDAFMAAAVRSAEQADPDFKHQMRALTSNHQYQSIIDQHRDILNKPAQERTHDDYLAISKMMRSLQNHAEKAEEQTRVLMTGSNDESSLKQHVANVLTNGAKTTADALMVFTLTRFLEEAAAGDILSYEYVDPDAMVMDREALRRVSNSVLATAERRGLMIAGESIDEHGKRIRVGEREAISAGTLVRKTPQGQFVALTNEEFIGFANDVVKTIGQDQAALVQKFLTASRGMLSDKMIHDAERSILEQFQPEQKTPDTQTTPSFAHKVMLEKATAHPTARPTIKERMDYVTRAESVHEMTQLRNRYLAVAMFGFPVKIVTNILRGDFNKISAAFGKWSLASAGFAAVANTLAPSYGAVAMKEAAAAGNIKLKQETEQADAHIQAAIHQLGASSPAMRDRLITSLGVNPLLGSERAIEQLALADPISALDNVAGAFIDHTATALAGSPQPILSGKAAKPAELLASIMRLPEGNAANAALKLAALSSILQHEKRYIDVLRFEGISARILDNKRLKEVVNRIEDRFYTEGDKVKTADPAYITAIADDLARSALPVIEATLDDKHQEEKPSSDYFRRKIATEVSKGLDIDR